MFSQESSTEATTPKSLSTISSDLPENAITIKSMSQIFREKKAREEEEEKMNQLQLETMSNIYKFNQAVKKANDLMDRKCQVLKLEVTIIQMRLQEMKVKV